MNWGVTHKSGPCYSNVSLIKRCMFQSKTGRLPYLEIVQYVINHWNKSKSTSEDDIKGFVDLALNARKSYFEEDINGLWGIRSKIDESLDPIINYVKTLHRPFQLKELVKKFRNFNNEKELKDFLLADIRFTELDGMSYWLLSEWDLINDQVYTYMQKRNIESAVISEIEESIIKKYSLDKNISIFFPKADERFTLRNKIVWIDLENGSNKIEAIIVPEVIKEDVARKSVKLLEWIEQHKGEFKTINCLLEVLHINANHSYLSYYCQAVDDFFETVPSLVKIKEGRWINVKVAPSLDNGKSNLVNYSVYNSTPDIKNVEELLVTAHSEKLENNLLTRDGNSSSEKSQSFTYTTISYYERVKGYLILPKFFLELLRLDDRKLGKTILNIEGYNYDCWLRLKDDKVFCYGSGIFDFYTDYLIEPGSKLKIEVDEQNILVINLQGKDERYALEQQRFLDIGILVEESKRVNKSIFSIMCEVLATHPSGMHWTTLYDEVTKIRSTTKNTITNLLSKNDCFENFPDMKGYWRLNITKLSGYYIDEDNKYVADEIIDDEELSNSNTVLNSEKIVQSGIVENVRGITQETNVIVTPSEVENFNDVEKEVIEVAEEIESIVENEIPRDKLDSEENYSNVVEEIVGPINNEDNVNLKDQEKISEIEVSHITSGKKYILSFIDTNNKQINSYPFILKNGTVTNGVRDHHYNYNFHWDLREGQDIEQLSHQFPEIFSYQNRELYKELRNISEAQYTELIKYKIFLLIKEGKFTFKKDDSTIIHVKWKGKDFDPPTWYMFENIDIEDDDSILQNENTLLSSVKLCKETTDEKVADNINSLQIKPTELLTMDNDSDQNFSMSMVTKEKDIDQDNKIIRLNDDIGHQVNINPISPNTLINISEQKEALEETLLSNTKDTTQERINSLENRILILEKKINSQAEEIQKYRKSMKIILGVAVGVGVAALFLNLFRS